MTPIVPPANPRPAPWWQTLVGVVLNAAIGALLNHYLGPTAAMGGMAAGTVAAHLAPSPLKRNGE